MRQSLQDSSYHRLWQPVELKSPNGAILIMSQNLVDIP